MIILSNAICSLQQIIFWEIWILASFQPPSPKKNKSRQGWKKTARAERAHQESVFVYHVYIVDDHYTIGVLEKQHSGWSYHIVRPNSSSLSLCIIISSCIPFLVAGSYPRTYLLNMLIYWDYHFLWQVVLLLDSQPSNLFNKNTTSCLQFFLEKKQMFHFWLRTWPRQNGGRRWSERLRYTNLTDSPLSKVDLCS